MTDESLYCDCDGNCPRPFGSGYCCKGCYEARKAFYESAPPEIQKLWQPRFGFWHPEYGCRLDREQRPRECRDYNCAEQILVMSATRQSRDWAFTVKELPKTEATEEAFIERARAVYADMRARALLPEPVGQSSWDKAAKWKDGPTVFILHGFMGSGKSTWAHKFLAVHPRARIVSGDGFRRMLHGEYRYDAAIDDVITAAMVSTIERLLADGYDVVVDVGNLSKQRRAPWIATAKGLAAKVVAIRFPQQHQDWHVNRRWSRPHWDVDWNKIFKSELASYEPLEDGEGYDDIIEVSVREVSGRKILILSASPARDRYIDELIARKLRELGHAVEVHPCQRGGREKVLEYQPDICIVPPIRNPGSRDFANTLKDFGCAVVVRHTEPSCSWQDWKKMTPEARTEILGAFQYRADLELVWSLDEADILNRFRPGQARTLPVGAIGLDIYFDEQLRRSMIDKPTFCAKYKLDPQKRTLLVTSPWGFADSSPDLATDEMTDAQADAQGRDAHIQMTREVVTVLRETWNILLSIHHGVRPEPYEALAQELGVLLDTDSPMMDMLPAVDAVIHAGSTAAVSAHLLKIPTFQFGDVNAAGGKSWWGVGESAISRVAPRFEKAADLIAAIQASTAESNANPETIKELEEGRYGLIDGKAVDRAVVHIDRLNGRFKYCWPPSPHDYRQLTIQREESDFFTKARCGVCHKTFCVLNRDYVQMLATRMKVDPKVLQPDHGIACPWCANRMYQTQGA